MEPVYPFPCIQPCFNDDGLVKNAAFSVLRFKLEAESLSKGHPKFVPLQHDYKRDYLRVFKLSRAAGPVHLWK